MTTEKSTETRGDLDGVRSVYVTFANEQEAEKIAKVVVTERLAACANLLGAVTSFYWWNDAVQSDPEVAVLFKTRAGSVERLSHRIVELHSYDCPCVVALNIDGGHPDYLRWITKETI